MKRSAWRYLWSAKDIRRKLLITLLILVIYRLAAHVPVPGADPTAIKALFTGGGAGASLVGILDLLSGGAVAQFSILAMGVYPYITAQIIIQLLVPIIPAWQKRMEEDPREGQKWMEKMTYFLSVPMAALNAIGQINIFNSLVAGSGLAVIDNFGWNLHSVMVVLAMSAGTMFAIWLGELISEFGIRNQGLSLIIFAGIVARIPASFSNLLSDEKTGWISLLIMLAVSLVTIFVIVFFQQGRRNIPVMYPGRRVGRGMSMPVKGTLPLMVNMAGMIPLIFAQSLLTFPAILMRFVAQAFTKVTWIQNAAVWTDSIFGGSSNWYYIIYFFLVVLFSFFYTDVLFAQQNYGENLKRVGARIGNVSPGAPTQKYLTRVLRRITLPGALFLGVVAILSWLVGLVWTPLASSSSALLVSSSGLLIVVGVVRDAFYNIDAELKLHGYDDKLLIR
jgi:preprotein translocase subunit SecY